MVEATNPSSATQSQRIPFSGEPSHKKWTVAIYMVADGRGGSSDLNQVAIRELTSIVQAARTYLKDIDVAIQLDLHGMDGTLRMMVREDNKGEGEFSKERNVASEETLREFFAWVTERSQSEHYLVLFWGHSSGPVVFVGDFEAPAETSATNGNGNGGEPRQASGATVGVLKRLGNAFRKDCGCFKTGKSGYSHYHSRESHDDIPIDIVLFKECFMSTLETALELDEVRFMIGSQGRVPRLGWPYAEIFRSLTLAGSDDPAKAAERILNELGEYYEVARNRRGKDDVPVTLVDVPRVREAADKLVPALVRELKTKGDSEQKTLAKTRAVKSAFNRSALGDPALLDLKILCTNLEQIGAEAAQELSSIASDLLGLFSGDHPAVRMAKPNSAFGGIGLFYFPHPLDALGPVHVGGSFIAPVVARHRERYEGLSISRTNWTSIALERLGGWNGNILASFKNKQTLDFTTLESISKASTLGDIFGRPTDIELEQIIDSESATHGKRIDFGDKSIDFGDKSIDFGKMMDFAKSIDFAKAFDLGDLPSDGPNL